MSYTENMYNYLKRQGHGEKYEHAGVYCISIDDTLVYIGKSHNMLKRIAQHMVGMKIESENKYSVLASYKRNGYNINFDVLYYAKETRYDDITEEIGEKEGELIRQFMPMLNTQIPTAENWRKYTCKEIEYSIF